MKIMFKKQTNITKFNVQFLYINVRKISVFSYRARLIFSEPFTFCSTLEFLYFLFNETLDLSLMCFSVVRVSQLYANFVRFHHKEW